MSSNNERVKRHRTAKGLIRVEVEVPTIDDALAVRRYAQRRREGQGGQPSVPTSQPEPPPAPEAALEATLAQLDGESLEALRLFAIGLAIARSSPALMARALRIAANYRDVAQAQGKTEQIEAGKDE